MLMKPRSGAGDFVFYRLEGSSKRVDVMRSHVKIKLKATVTGDDDGFTLPAAE